MCNTGMQLHMHNNVQIRKNAVMLCIIRNAMVVCILNNGGVHKGVFNGKKFRDCRGTCIISADMFLLTLQCDVTFSL